MPVRIERILVCFVTCLLISCSPGSEFYQTIQVPEAQDPGANPTAGNNDGDGGFDNTNDPKNEGTGGTIPTNSGECGSANFQQRTQRNAKLDVLVIIDTSGSMAEELRKVGEQFEFFFRSLHQKHSDLDFQIAVMLAHAESSRSGWFWQPSQCENPLVIAGNGQSNFIEEIKPALTCKLENFQTESTSAGEGEAGFLSLLRAMGPNLDRMKQEGFFRDDAGLSVVFVSDENEVCNFPAELNEPQQYETALRNSGKCDGATPELVYRRIRAVKGNVPVTIAAMVDADAQTASSRYGWGYYNGNTGIDFPGIVNIAGANGIATDIHGTPTQIGEDLEAIGERVAENLEKLLTFRVPADREVERINWVKVNDQNVPFNWSDAAQEVRLEWEHAGNDRDRIEVNYCLK